MNDPEASPREATSAARAILTASKINLHAIETTIKARQSVATGPEPDLLSTSQRFAIPDVDDRPTHLADE